MVYNFADECLMGVLKDKIYLLSMQTALNQDQPHPCLQVDLINCRHLISKKQLLLMA